MGLNPPQRTEEGSLGGASKVVLDKRERVRWRVPEIGKAIVGETEDGS